MTDQLHRRAAARQLAAESRGSALSLKRRGAQRFARTLATSVGRPSRRFSDDSHSDLEQI
ncbi:MAG: hypothetical protein ACREL4_09165 [Gemmatimonadales bacterium]